MAETDYLGKLAKKTVPFNNYGTTQLDPRFEKLREKCYGVWAHSGRYHRPHDSPDGEDGFDDGCLCEGDREKILVVRDLGVLLNVVGAIKSPTLSGEVLAALGKAMYLEHDLLEAVSKIVHLWIGAYNEEAATR